MAASRVITVARPVRLRGSRRRQIAAADVFGQGEGDLLRQVGRTGTDGVIRAGPDTVRTAGRARGPIMHINMGIESKKLMREAYKAALRAAAFCSSVAGLIPKIFCWLGQMMPIH